MHKAGRSKGFPLSHNHYTFNREYVSISKRMRTTHAHAHAHHACDHQGEWMDGRMDGTLENLLVVMHQRIYIREGNPLLAKPTS